MEVKGILKRSQSLRSVSTDHGLTWTEAGLRDKRKSVSQLVAQYQNSPGIKTKTVDSGDIKHQLTLQVTPITLNDADGKLKSPVRKSDISERSRTSPLSRSKSMENLPQRRPVGTTALRELFESKVSIQPRSRTNNMAHEPIGTDKAQTLPNNNNTTSQAEAEVKNSHDKQDEKTEVDQMTSKNARTNPITSRSERRKTISGIYTENRSFPEEDKRRSVADFRDSSALHGREITSISVKTLSALYLSKVAAAEPAGNLFKPEQDLTSPTGKRIKPFKMAEGAQNISQQHLIEYEKENASELIPPTNHLEVSIEECERPFTSPPPTRETMYNMHQRRQKCELKRLLKHTCPELKNVDSLVDEELADILNTDPDKDTGYQSSEVLSRRWLFENQATRDLQDVRSTSGLSEEPLCSSHNDDNKLQYVFQTKTQLNEAEEVTSEESIKVDVKATRKMFEIQSPVSSKERQVPCPKRNVVYEEQSRSEQKPKTDSCDFTDGTKTSNIHHNNLPSVTDTNEVFVGVSRAKQVFENRSHEQESISTSFDSLSKEEEMLKANVKNRAQMFESTPLDKINQQTKEESETMLESMQDTLISLWNFNIIQTDGSILEANETGHVRKARYSFTKDSKPEVHDEEILTGSIKNIMLQVLPGTNLNPIVTFLKEDSQGNVEIHKVDVPTHLLPFTVLQDKDCRIANVVQITEDLLGQEKSLRKGVLIQDCGKETREITVYALFSHSEESTRMMEFGKMDCKSVSSNQIKILEPENKDVKIDISCTTGAVTANSSATDLEASRTINVQLVRSCIEKGDLDHLKHLQKTLSDEDIIGSSEEIEKTSEIISGNVKNIKALFSTNVNDTSLILESAKSRELKVSSTESVKTTKTEELMQTQDEKHSEMDNKGEIFQDQDITDDGAVLKAELVDVVEDDELLNLQTAIRNLHHATMEAKALQQSVQAKLQPETNQIQQITDPGSASHELTEVKQDNNTTEDKEPLQTSKREQEEGSDDGMRGSIQVALESLGKSNFNVTKGDFRAAMIYRNTVKAYAGHKKVTYDQSSDRTAEETKKSSSGLQTEQQVLNRQHEGVDTASCQMPSENKTLTKQMHVSTNAPPKKRKTPIGPKPAIPPKPDHLKMKPNPTDCDTKADHKGQVKTSSSNQPNEEIKDPSSCPKSCPDPMSYKDVLCKNLQVSGNTCDTSVNIKINDGPMQAVEESPKSSAERSTRFQATLQNFEAKAGGSVAPVKPKRIKMAKDHVKNSTENMKNNIEIQRVDITPQCNGSPHDSTSSCETYKREKNDKCDDEQKSEVVRRKKKTRRETEDERRQRLSVHMDEIMKGNVTVVIDIFDKLKKQEELKTILSKVEEMKDDTNKVNVSSIINIFENVPDWVVPQEETSGSKTVTRERRVGDSDSPVEPEMMSSMQAAFGDLEKAGAEIIHLKEQTLARLMDIEEAIKKALYSVSTLKSDSDIVGLSGLFRESMVAVQGSPNSGNIRKISIGSSKSPKAQNGQATKPVSMPECLIPTTKQRSVSPASPSFISIQSAARKPEESQISPQKAKEIKHQCCCTASSDRKQCAVVKEVSFSPANPRRQVSVLEVQTAPEERVIGTKTISENYEKTDCFGNKFYSSKTSTVVTTQPETKTTSKKFITTSPATTEIATYPRINTPLIREDRPPM
ncbi:putative xin actin-binding repeat-containing protein 1-like [Triplophysa rosa]|uniref:Xin actin-binding repeat-containing protein 1-like n=1 Tax=Triplophysa rosa TaxID=992332 RepID=A0A9W7TAU7_TRIRA|nr:putative xin actin-binding repeat-containing protein 1-like [Triplophysa rosa]